MRMNQRLGLLSTMLLALGAVDLPPPRKDENLAEAEQVMRDLSAADISAPELVAAVGPDDFVVMGRAVLELHRTLLAFGQHVTDVAVLLRELENLTIERRHDAGAAAIMATHHRLADEALERMRLACGRMLRENSVLVGETERGPTSEAKTVTASEFAASFGEPVDSGDLPRPMPNLFEQKHAEMRKRIDADVAARIDRSQQSETDFTPRNVALDALDHLTGTGVDWESLVFPDRQRSPLVYTGVDMAAPGRFDRTAITLVTNMDSELAETVKAKTTWASLCAMPREPRTHNRPTQRAAKKSRARTKARRGY